MSGMVIMDIPSEILDLGACVSCMAGKSVHVPHKGTGWRPITWNPLTSTLRGLCWLFWLEVGNMYRISSTTTLALCTRGLSV